MRKNVEEQRREMTIEEFNERFVNKEYWGKKGGNKKKGVHGIMCEHMIPNGAFNALRNHDDEPTLLLTKSLKKTLPLNVKGT